MLAVKPEDHFISSQVGMNASYKYDHIFQGALCSMHCESIDNSQYLHACASQPQHPADCVPKTCRRPNAGKAWHHLSSEKKGMSEFIYCPADYEGTTLWWMMKSVTSTTYDRHSRMYHGLEYMKVMLKAMTWSQTPFFCTT